MFTSPHTELWDLDWSYTKTQEWLSKCDLIRRIHLYDQELCKLHVEVDEFLTFFTDKISLCELENLLNMAKEMDSKAQDIMSLIYTIREKNFNKKMLIIVVMHQSPSFFYK